MKARRTLFYWSIYVALVGAGLAVIPDQMLAVLGFEESGELWIRLLGVALLLLALYYYEGSRTGSTGFIAATVLGRGFVVGVYVVLWITGEPWQLLIFAAGEVIGMAWTYLALKAERS